MLKYPPMLFVARLRLQKPLLGHKFIGREQDAPCYKFMRHKPSGLIVLDEDMWAASWEAAFSCTPFYTHAIVMQSRIADLTTHVFELKTRNAYGSGFAVTRHESVRAGAVITLAGRVRTLDPDERASIPPDKCEIPTIRDVERGLSIIGEDLGISPYAKHRGYGRFTVLSLTTPDDYQMCSSAAVVERFAPHDQPDDAGTEETADPAPEIVA